MDKELAVVAVSGGLDSCVTTAIANQEYELALVHINYGQKTESRELQSFHKIADYYKVNKKLVFDFSHFQKIGGSSLTDKTMEISKANLNNKEVPTSYVPFRNANILSACVSWAEVIGAKSIFIGAVFEDSSGYPDCRPEFFKSFEQTANLGTKPETRIKIETPIIHLTKKEIIKLGLDLKAPLELTWSCYSNGEEACGICDSCALRLRGFQSLNIVDPIPYKEIPNYKEN
ncbi:MAG: 7-cyano-7-deazaguanine synthase QueC [Ignavibacteriales bacterium]|nr:7-cyano-7-deazaguanine synthase QueC [Ignavibacteriales bacterium]MBK7978587.1 7-cyano-7-deazaguanine synthase QueC [Ignavibacteriota bacterium]